MYTSYKDVPCTDIAEKLGIVKSNYNHRYHCFRRSEHAHDDMDPSMVIYDERWKCEACDAGDNNGKYSNNVALVKVFHNWNTNQAIRWINTNFINRQSRNNKRTDFNDDTEKMQIRFIKPGNEHRFEFRSESELKLREATLDDCENIWAYLNKSYCPETLQEAGVKINDGKFKNKNGEVYDGYGMVFPKS